MGSDCISFEAGTAPLRFNPRSPHGERQASRCRKTSGQYRFQSTLPAWGATVSNNNIRIYNICFNPRSPHGERLAQHVERGLDSGVSIHAPRMGSDPREFKILLSATGFNPRSPHGERPTRHTIGFLSQCSFNPRSPHGERR